MLLSLSFGVLEPFFVIIFLLSLLFFRKKGVKNLSDQTQILAPVDGKILEISVGEFEGEVATKVVIEKSLCGVGLLYAPFNADASQLRQRHGLFLCNYQKSSATLNERAIFSFKSGELKFAMRVVAGAFSRSLELKNLANFKKGDELGFLGSGRVVLFLPKEVKISVSVGEKVKSLFALGYLEKRV